MMQIDKQVASYTVMLTCRDIATKLLMDPPKDYLPNIITRFSDSENHDRNMVNSDSKKNSCDGLEDRIEINIEDFISADSDDRLTIPPDLSFSALLDFPVSLSNSPITPPIDSQTFSSLNDDDGDHNHPKPPPNRQSGPGPGNSFEDAQLDVKSSDLKQRCNPNNL